MASADYLPQGVLHHVGGKRLVGVTQGLTHDEGHGQDHVAGGLEARRQDGVGVQGAARFFELAPQGRDTDTGSGIGGGNLLDVRESRVELRLGVEHQSAHELGATGSQGVDHFRVDIAGPRPATQVLDALVVDGDDGQAIAGLALGAAHAQVVGDSLQPLQGIVTRPSGGPEYKANY
jgi:hypothetical protein